MFLFGETHVRFDMRTTRVLDKKRHAALPHGLLRGITLQIQATDESTTSDDRDPEARGLGHDLPRVARGLRRRHLERAYCAPQSDEVHRGHHR
jgi:hypothetical protein